MNEVEMVDCSLLPEDQPEGAVLVETLAHHLTTLRPLRAPCKPSVPVLDRTYAADLTPEHWARVQATLKASLKASRRLVGSTPVPETVAVPPAKPGPLKAPTWKTGSGKAEGKALPLPAKGTSSAFKAGPKAPRGQKRGRPITADPATPAAKRKRGRPSLSQQSAVTPGGPSQPEGVPVSAPDHKCNLTSHAKPTAAPAPSTKATSTPDPAPSPAAAHTPLPVPAPTIKPNSAKAKPTVTPNPAPTSDPVTAPVTNQKAASTTTPAHKSKSNPPSAAASQPEANSSTASSAASSITPTPKSVSSSASKPKSTSTSTSTTTSSAPAPAHGMPSATNVPASRKATTTKAQPKSTSGPKPAAQPASNAMPRAPKQTAKRPRSVSPSTGLPPIPPPTPSCTNAERQRTPCSGAGPCPGPRSQKAAKVTAKRPRLSGAENPRPTKQTCADLPPAPAITFAHPGPPAKLPSVAAVHKPYPKSRSRWAPITAGIPELALQRQAAGPTPTARSSCGGIAKGKRASGRAGKKGSGGKRGAQEKRMGPGGGCRTAAPKAEPQSPGPGPPPGPDSCGKLHPEPSAAVRAERSAQSKAGPSPQPSPCSDPVDSLTASTALSLSTPKPNGDTPARTKNKERVVVSSDHKPLSHSTAQLTPNPQGEQSSANLMPDTSPSPSPKPSPDCGSDLSLDSKPQGSGPNPNLSLKLEPQPCQLNNLSSIPDSLRSPAAAHGPISDGCELLPGPLPTAASAASCSVTHIVVSTQIPHVIPQREIPSTPDLSDLSAPLCNAATAHPDLCNNADTSPTAGFGRGSNTDAASGPVPKRPPILVKLCRPIK